MLVVDDPGWCSFETESSTLPVARLVGRREITPARPHRHPRPLHLHFELVHLAVERDGCKPDQVLTAQLLRDARERRRELRRLQQLEVAAAGLVRDLAQIARRPRFHDAHAVEVFGLQADRVDHHFFIARALEHGLETESGSTCLRRR